MLNTNAVSKDRRWVPINDENFEKKHLLLSEQDYDMQIDISRFRSIGEKIIKIANDNAPTDKQISTFSFVVEVGRGGFFDCLEIGVCTYRLETDDEYKQRILELQEESNKNKEKDEKKFGLEAAIKILAENGYKITRE